MNLRPVEVARGEEMPEALVTASEEAPRHAATTHAGFLEGATATGEAARRQLAVRIGLWMDDRGAIRQARWRAVREVNLRACAEAACVLLEEGTDPLRLDADLLRRGASESAAARECAEVVAAAVQASVMACGAVR